MWTITQIKSIFKDETYIGSSVHNRQTNISYKNMKRIRKPQDEWFRVENTHGATKSAVGLREQEIEIYYRFIGKID